jgi:hypothetical protein
MPRDVQSRGSGRIEALMSGDDQFLMTCEP